MLITFKSKAAADLIMYKEHARRILDLLGKDVDQGIITAEETGPAIAALEAEIARQRMREAEEAKAAAQEHDEGKEDGGQPRETVSFATRAFPLLEMLRAANKAKANIAWGI